MPEFAESQNSIENYFSGSTLCHARESFSDWRWSALLPFASPCMLRDAEK